MSAKLRLGEPVLVSMGPPLAKVGWGPYQFPGLSRMSDGRIALSYHAVMDTCEDYGKERSWAVSSDDGKTWTPVSDAELPGIKARSGLRLPSGKYLRCVVHRPWPISDELHAELSKKSVWRSHCLSPDVIPDYFPKTWTFSISDPDGKNEETFDCELDFPGMTMGLCQGAIVRPMVYGNLRLAPDGSVWVPQYQQGRNPVNLGFTSYYACYFLQSTDEGRSFHLKSWIQYLPDSNEFRDAFTTEGFCEPDICWQPDGSMLCLMRTGSSTPSYIARSTDGGLTWSKPEKFDQCGVLPQLLPLKCGVTLASYGRPGVFVRATDDPSGVKWDDPVTVKPLIWENSGHDSCSYTSMVPLDDRTALLAYSDFEIPNEKGELCKCIMVRTVTVE